MSTSSILITMVFSSLNWQTYFWISFFFACYIFFVFFFLQKLFSVPVFEHPLNSMAIHFNTWTINMNRSVIANSERIEIFFFILSFHQMKWSMVCGKSMNKIKMKQNFEWILFSYNGMLYFIFFSILLSTFPTFSSILRIPERK